MKIELSKYAGFCPGVKNADRLVRSLINDKSSGRIFTLGHLIHNRLYNEELESLGVRSVELSEVEELASSLGDERMTLVIRTHGIPKEDEQYLNGIRQRHRNLSIVDATCGYVKRIHKIADENTDENSVFLLYCDPNHPEAKGILSYAKGEKIPFSHLSEIEGRDFGTKRLIICSQTTQNLKKLKIFSKKYIQIQFFLIQYVLSRKIVRMKR